MGAMEAMEGCMAMACTVAISGRDQLVMKKIKPRLGRRGLLSPSLAVAMATEVTVAMAITTTTTTLTMAMDIGSPWGPNLFITHKEVSLAHSASQTKQYM